MVIALFTYFVGILLANISVSSFLVKALFTDAKRTARVVVLIPPAVPEGEPPIVIRKIRNQMDVILIRFESIFINPALLQEAERKKLLINLLNTDHPSMADVSAKKKNRVPITRRIRVVVNTILVCVDLFLNLFGFIRSLKAMYPNPPIMVRNARVSKR